MTEYEIDGYRLAFGIPLLPLPIFGGQESKPTTEEAIESTLDEPVAWIRDQIRELGLALVHVQNTIRGLEAQRDRLDGQIAHLRGWLLLAQATAEAIEFALED